MSIVKPTTIQINFFAVGALAALRLHCSVAKKHIRPTMPHCPLSRIKWIEGFKKGMLKRGVYLVPSGYFEPPTSLQRRRYRRMTLC